MQGTVLVEAGSFRESGTLKVGAGVTLEGSGASTILESDATVVACADGAVRVANLTIRQCADSSSEPRFGMELRGKTIRTGESVCLFYASGNRDEDVFEEPFRFRIDRKPNDHIGFGRGEHVCLGAHLARGAGRARSRGEP